MLIFDKSPPFWMLSKFELLTKITQKIRCDLQKKIIAQLFSLKLQPTFKPFILLFNITHRPSTIFSKWWVNNYANRIEIGPLCNNYNQSTSRAIIYFLCEKAAARRYRDVSVKIRMDCGTIEYVVCVLNANALVSRNWGHGNISGAAFHSLGRSLNQQRRRLLMVSLSLCNIQHQRCAIPAHQLAKQQWLTNSIIHWAQISWV